MVSNINATSGASSVQGVSSDLSSTSVQMAFALLQMELAKTHKDSAMGRIEEIRYSQSNIKACNDVKNALKTVKDYDVEKYGPLPTNLDDINKELKALNSTLDDLERAKGTASDSSLSYVSNQSKDYYMSLKGSAYAQVQSGSDNAHYLSELNSGIDALSARKEALLAYQTALGATTTDSQGNKVSIMQSEGMRLDATPNTKDFDTYIAKLDSKAESIGSDQQTLMVLIQEDMGQYNSYTQGASAQVSKFSDVLSTLAQSR